MGFMAILPTILKATPAIATLASSLLGKKKKSSSQTVSQEPMQTSYQQQTDSNLVNWINKYIDQFAPGQAYPGNLTTTTTPYESQSLDILNKYLTSPNTGELFNAASQHILKTFGGEYADPDKSPFIQSMKKLGLRNLQEQIDTSRATRGTRGAYFHTKSLEEESNLTSKTLDYLNTIIGQFIEGERQNMLSAVPTAAELDQYRNVDAPLKKVWAGQTYGSLARVIDAENMERQYGAWRDQREEMALPAKAGAQTYGTAVPYGIKNWQIPQAQPQNNTFGRIADLVPKIWKIGQTIWPNLPIFKS